MAHTLVTFLGRPQRQGDSYRTANYSFPDGHESGPKAFFGLALAEYLKPTKTVILGTPGSMWGGLVSGLVENGEVDEGLADLREAEKTQNVTLKMLRGVTGTLERVFSCEVVEPRLIPFGKDAEEQYQILNYINVAVTKGRVSFDLTHGFRHLGMVGFLSAFMLERIRNDLDVCSLWYGALDMTNQDGITPVLELDGLNGVRRWVDALNRFDASGDYGVLEPLLVADGVPEDEAKHLKQAAFHERTLNLSSAVAEIDKFLPALNHDLKGASRLFKSQLLSRLAWAKHHKLAKRQHLLALEYLKRNDFIRATVFGWEALATLECSRREGFNIDNFEDRKKVIKVLGKELEKGSKKRKAFFTLRGIRNALAHGDSSPPNYIKEILQDADNLKNVLHNAFKRLLH